MSARILLVDDDAQGLSSTKKILDSAGFSTETAEDGQIAIDRVRKEQFDLVIS